MKKKLTLTVDDDLVKQAKKLDLNISDLVESNLRAFINILNTNNCVARCPRCAEFTVSVTGETRDDPKNPAATQSVTVCTKCGLKFWSYL